MNKSDLVTQLSEKSEIGLTQSEEIVSLIFDEMSQTLAKGHRIEIRGFGSFIVKTYGSRWGRNPKTKEKIWVNEKRLPAFKIGKELKERINRLGDVGAF